VLLVLTVLASAVNLAMAATALAVPVPAAAPQTHSVERVDADHASPGTGRDVRIVKKVKGLFDGMLPLRPPLSSVGAVRRTPHATARSREPGPVPHRCGYRRGPPPPSGVAVSDRDRRVSCR